MPEAPVTDINRRKRLCESANEGEGGPSKVQKPGEAATAKQEVRYSVFAGLACVNIICFAQVKEDKVINVQNLARFGDVVERYYDQVFRADEGSEMEDFYIHLHVNGLAVVGIAPCHPILRLGLTVEGVNFNANGKDYLKSKAQGKKKKGAAKLDDKTVVCDVLCTNGQTYRMRRYRTTFDLLPTVC
jgi:hypothetical protein